MGIKKIATGMSFLILIFGSSCNNECKFCNRPIPTSHIFFIYYKSDTIPDLLNPRAGIYDPSKVMIYEEINKNGKVVRALANYSYDSIYQLGYVYRLKYHFSLSPQNYAQKSLIQLKTGVVDTLTYESWPGAYPGAFPSKIYCNGKAVWHYSIPLSDDITITK